MTGEPNTPAIRAPHDWHSPEYVREWVAENEARAAHREAQFELIADFIPHPGHAAIRILDIGAGWGPVTRRVLGRFPNASSVLLDYSEAMFAEARPRLAHFGERVRYVVGDLSQPGSIAAAMAANGGPFDAAVSSSCIHNVRATERIPRLYREVREATAAGGCFLNLDMLGTAAPELRAAWHRARVEQLRRQRLAETDVLPSFEQAEQELLAQRRRYGGGAPPVPAAGGAQAQPPAGQPTFATSGGAARSLLDHLTWLRRAGFDAEECFWREGNRALIGAYVASAPRPRSRPWRPVPARTDPPRRGGRSRTE